MHHSHILHLLLTGYLAHVRCITNSNSSKPIYLTYAKLRNDILNRPAAVHKIPPCLESKFLDRYVLQLANLIISIQNFDEIRQVMTLQMYFAMTWYHPELSWDASDYDNITDIWIDSSNIWTPNIEVNMGQEKSSSLDFSGILELNHLGGIRFMKLGFLSFDCNIDFHHYPFDSQTCKFGFYPHGPPYADPQFFASNFSLSDMYTVSKEWSFEEPVRDIQNFHEAGSPLIIYVATYRLTVRRKSLYYVMSVVFPMVLTSMMIPLVFVIPANSGEKVAYLVAIFTSTAIFLNFISDVMPRSLSRLPYLAALLTEVLAEGFLAMLATLLVVNLHIKEKSEDSKNKENKRSRVGEMYPQNAETSKQLSDVTTKGVALQRAWFFTSRRLDNAFFFLFTSGQIGFNLMLFIGTDWLKSEKA